MAGDQTPNSLIKVNTPITSKYGTAQILIFTAAGFSIIYLIQFIVNNRDNQDYVSYGILCILGILAAVFFGARSDYALYNSERFLIFNSRQALKIDEIYKYSKKTTSRIARRFTGLLYADDKGHLKFKTFTTYARQKCNRGFCYLVTPSTSQDLDSFYAGIERLYNSLPPGTLHKTTIAQSKNLTNIVDYYEKKLQNKNLPIAVRRGLQAKKQYFETVKETVGWMYVIFVGVGYFVEDQEAYTRIDEIRDSYTQFLTITGIKVKPVFDAQEYAVIYSQMFHMQNLQGLV
jgi:hypothetical protein